MKYDLQNALIDSYTSMLEEYDSLAAASTPHRFSDGFLLRMEQICGKAQSPVRVRRLRKVVLVAVLIAALLASSIAVLATVYPEYFMKIKETLRAWKISFVQEKGGEEEAPFVLRKIEVPAGFQLKEEYREETSYDAVYQKGESTIIYTQEQVNEATSIGLDAENDYMEHVKLNGKDVILSKKKDLYTLFWTEGNCTYTLIGNVELDVLKKIQKNL